MKVTNLFYCARHKPPAPMQWQGELLNCLTCGRNVVLPIGEIIEPELLTAQGVTVDEQVINDDKFNDTAKPA